MTDVLVLCYHAISPTWSADLSVTPEALEAQLRRLVRVGWRGTTFEEGVLRPPWPRTLAITFDDAFLSVLELGHPILTDLRLRGTIFAPTAFLDRRQPLRWAGIDHWSQTPDRAELQSMDWNDLEKLAGEGWEIGSHTRTHPHLTQLDDAALAGELEESRRECALRIGRPCNTLAYPYGDVDARVAARAADAGYLCAASLTVQSAGSVHRWPRVGVYHGDAAWRFRLKVNRPLRRVRGSRLWPQPAGS